MNIHNMFSFMSLLSLRSAHSSIVTCVIALLGCLLLSLTKSCLYCRLYKLNESLLKTVTLSILIEPVRFHSVRPALKYTNTHGNPIEKYMYVLRLKSRGITIVSVHGLLQIVFYRYDIYKLNSI
jgi:hypothetical protein